MPSGWRGPSWGRPVGRVPRAVGGCQLRVGGSRGVRWWSHGEAWWRRRRWWRAARARRWGRAVVPAFADAVDLASSRGRETLCGGVAAACDYREVVVGRRFCLNGRRERGEVPLPVVRPIFEVELLVCVDRRDGRKNHPGAVGNTIHSEVGASVEPIIDPTSPAGADGRVGIYIDGGLAGLGEDISIVFVCPDVPHVIGGALDPCLSPHRSAVV